MTIWKKINVRTITIFISIALVVIFSLGKTLGYYFYTDDYALIYHLQRNLQYGWPYRYLTDIFSLPYRLFGIDPTGYFILGVGTYLLVTVALYFFAFILTKNKLIAFFSSLIYATGYIGIDQFTQIISTYNNLNNLNILIILTLFIIWLEKKQLWHYFGAFTLFWLGLITLTVRAFPLVLFLPIVSIFLTVKYESGKIFLKTMFYAILITLPFFVIAYFSGIFSYGTIYNHTSIGSRILSILSLHFAQSIFSILGGFVLLKNVTGLLNFTPTISDYSIAGIIFFLFIVLLSLVFSKNYEKLSRTLLIALFMSIAGYIGYSILLLGFDENNGPANRYLSTAFLGYSIIFPTAFYVLLKKIVLSKIKTYFVFLFLISPIILSMIFLSNQYEEGILIERSIPARQFFVQIKNYVPSLSGPSVFYLDSANYYPVVSRFGSIVLGALMAKEVILASMYGVPIESVRISRNFDDLINSLKENKNKTHYFAFFYDEKGLHQTTNQVFSLLKKSIVDEVLITNQNSADKFHPKIEIPILKVSSLTPYSIRIQMVIQSLDASFFKFPFFDSKAVDQNSLKSFYDKNVHEKQKIFNYLISRKIYYNTVKVDVSSSHVAGQNPGSYLTDDNPDTNWLSNESSWQINIKPWIKLDLGEERNISRLLWVQLPDRAITGFTILTSLDGNTWTKVNNIRQIHVVSDANLIVNNFVSVNARYVMLNINSTRNGFTPGLSEIEVIQDMYKDIDIGLSRRIMENPFEYVKNQDELMQTYSYIAQAGHITLSVKTNKEKNLGENFRVRLPVALDGQLHEYNVPVAAGGTILESVSLEDNFPAIIKLQQIQILHPSLSEL